MVASLPNWEMEEFQRLLELLYKHIRLNLSDSWSWALSSDGFVHCQISLSKLAREREDVFSKPFNLDPWDT